VTIAESPPERTTFAERLVELYTGAALTHMIALGARTGLFAAAASGPATSQELADRAGLNERYVREWLAALSAGGVFDYAPDTATYTLPPERAELLSGNSYRNLAPMSQTLVSFGQHVPALAACFRDGGGVPYSAFRPEFTERMDDSWRRIYDELLIDGFLGAVPGVIDRLRDGIRVADVGCGTGHAVNLMAQAFPASTFTGYDIAEDAIAAGRAEAAGLGSANATFELRDARELPSDPGFDLITAFDVIHDQVHPAAVLASIRSALADDGTFLMIDFKFSSRLENNLDNPFAALYYTISTMHCMTVSLAEGGDGLGTVWGLELAERMLRAAGFNTVTVLDAPRPQNCIVICRR
jgi:SAM-dependent methyltransferase